MISKNDKGRMILTFELPGEGEGLLRLQKGLLLGIELIGSHKDQSGYEDHQEAVWTYLHYFVNRCWMNHKQMSDSGAGSM